MCSFVKLSIRRTAHVEESSVVISYNYLTGYERRQFEIRTAPARLAGPRDILPRKRFKTENFRNGISAIPRTSQCVAISLFVNLGGSTEHPFSRFTTVWNTVVLK